MTLRSRTSNILPICRDRTKEILSDERVQAAQKAGRGGRVRSEEESAAASSVTVVGKSDSRAQASPAQNGTKPAQNRSQPAQVPFHATPSSPLLFHSTRGQVSPGQNGCKQARYP